MHRGCAFCPGGDADRDGDGKGPLPGMVSAPPPTKQLCDLGQGPALFGATLASPLKPWPRESQIFQSGSRKFLGTYCAPSEAQLWTWDLSPQLPPQSPSLSEVWTGGPQTVCDHVPSWVG